MRVMLLFCLAASVLVAQPSTDQVSEEVAYLLFNRHLDAGYLDSAYALLKSARASAPTHERCLYLWCRIHIQLGDNAKSDAKKLVLYSRARAIAETLKSVNDENADGHVWWGVAHGRIGQTRGVMNSLFMVPALKKAFNRGLELDPNHATACDALGVMYYELPGLAGGDLNRSIQYLKRGIEADPNYTLLRLDLATVYVKQKAWDKARAELEALRATETPTYPADFELDDKPDAEKLLERIRDK